MGIVAKQASLNAAVIFGGTIFGAINTILVLPHAFAEEKAALGFIGFMVSLAMISAQFFSLSSASILVNFVAKSQDEEYNNGLVTLLFKASLLAITIFVGLFLITESTIKIFLSESNALYYSIYRIPIIIFTGSMVFYNLFAGYLLAKLDSVAVNFLISPFTKMSYLALATAYLFGVIDYKILIYLLVFSYLFIAITAAVRALQRGFRFTSSAAVKNTKEIINYGSYSLLDKGAGVIIQRLDILMVAFILDFEFAADFMIAFFIGSVVIIPFNAIQSIANPILSKEVKANNIPEMDMVYKRTALYSFLLGALIFGCTWINVDEILLILPEKFRSGKWVIFFIGISKLVQTLGSLSAGVIVYSKYFKFILGLNLMLLFLTILSNILLIITFGINGAAAATALTLLIFSMIKVGFVKQKFGILPFTRNTLMSIIIFATLTLGLTFVEIPIHPFLSILVKSVLFSVAFLIGIRVFKIVPQVKSISDLKRVVSGK